MPLYVPKGVKRTALLRKLKLIELLLASVATNLAIAASLRNGSPRAALSAASKVTHVACLMSISLSTSIHWIP